jgi:hypothetical protein
MRGLWRTTAVSERRYRVGALSVQSRIRSYVARMVRAFWGVSEVAWGVMVMEEFILQRFF